MPEIQSRDCSELLEKELLEKENRILRKKIARMEREKLRLEETNQKKEALLRTVIQESQLAQSCLEQKTTELANTLKELKNTQAKLIHSEKMSSLEQLVAGIAHEINNPVSFIHSNLDPASNYILDILELIQLYQKYFPQPPQAIIDHINFIDLNFIIEDLPRLINSMEIGTERIRDIVMSLRSFSRLDEAEIKRVDIHDGINSALMILNHRIKATQNRPRIHIYKKYGNLPLVECYSSQLNQVFMNILVNAIDAIEELYKNKDDSQQNNNQFTPTIHIHTEAKQSEAIIIRIADNGVGIPKKVQKKLFDPFYTTKAVGKGTGLGLSISYQIITHKHGGSLKCVSTPGEGAEFMIEIPTRLLFASNA